MSKIINFKDMVKGIYGVDVFLRSESLMETVDDINVYQQSGFVAYATRSVIAITTTSFTKEPIIVVDEFFEKMDMKYGDVFHKFVIGHELGHVRNGDLFDGNGEVKKEIPRTLEMETAADQFSMKYYGLSKKETIYALKAIIKEYPWYSFKAKKELRERIKIIKSF